MVLALDYMRRTGQDRPEIAARAREHIAAGYERLLHFEVTSEPGGFDWWGKAPANLFLTAYALMEFRDLAEVHPVDPALLARITQWLVAKQRADGSWSPDGTRTGWSTDMAKGRAFDLTAYVTWGMARAKAPTAKAVAYLEANVAGVTNPYGLALAALALLTTDPTSAVGHGLVARLVPAVETDDHGAFWSPTDETGIGARGESAAIETTALAIQALLLDGRHAALAARALERLAAWRGADGRFGTTQSTILALKALLAAEAGRSKREDFDVEVAGAGKARTVHLPADSTEPVRLDLAGVGREPLAFTPTGGGHARVDLTRTTWVPWSAPHPSKGRLALDVRWPVDVLTSGRRATATVEIRNMHPKNVAKVVTLEIGIPPGCDVEPEDVRGEGAERVERAERAIVIYLRDLPAAEVRAFEIAFRPRYALDVLTAPSKAYEYYVPEELVEVGPQRVRARR